MAILNIPQEILDEIIGELGDSDLTSLLPYQRTCSLFRYTVQVYLDKRNDTLSLSIKPSEGPLRRTHDFEEHAYLCGIRKGRPTSQSVPSYPLHIISIHDSLSDKFSFLFDSGILDQLHTSGTDERDPQKCRHCIPGMHTCAWPVSWIRPEASWRSIRLAGPSTGGGVEPIRQIEALSIEGLSLEETRIVMLGIHRNPRNFVTYNSQIHFHAPGRPLTLGDLCDLLLTGLRQWSKDKTSTRYETFSTWRFYPGKVISPSTKHMRICRSDDRWSFFRGITSYLVDAPGKATLIASGHCPSATSAGTPIPHPVGPMGPKLTMDRPKRFFPPS